MVHPNVFCRGSLPVTALYLHQRLHLSEGGKSGQKSGNSGRIYNDVPTMLNSVLLAFKKPRLSQICVLTSATLVVTRVVFGREQDDKERADDRGLRDGMGEEERNREGQGERDRPRERDRVRERELRRSLPYKK